MKKEEQTAVQAVKKPVYEEVLALVRELTVAERARLVEVVADEVRSALSRYTRVGD